MPTASISAEDAAERFAFLGAFAGAHNPTTHIPRQLRIAAATLGAQVTALPGASQISRHYPNGPALLPSFPPLGGQAPGCRSATQQTWRRVPDVQVCLIMA